MESLVIKCAKTIIKTPVLLNDVCKGIILDNLYVYVPIQVLKTRSSKIRYDDFNFMNVVMSTYEKAQKILDNNIVNTADSFIVKYKLDPKFPCNRVYVLINKEGYPQIVTNDYEEFLYHRHLDKLYYRSVIDDDLKENGIIIDDDSYIISF